MPKQLSDAAKLLVEQTVSQLGVTSAALAALKHEMQSLASLLPEYPIVMECSVLALLSAAFSLLLNTPHTDGRSFFWYG